MTTAWHIRTMRRRFMGRPAAAVSAGVRISRPAIVLFALALFAACGSKVFSQNIGPAHKVKSGMTPDEARSLLGEPLKKVSLSGVEEWRYCATRTDSNVFVVLYFQNDRVIEKATYTLDPYAPLVGPAAQEDRASCRAGVDSIYTDKRSPPRRVQELRKGG